MVQIYVFNRKQYSIVFFNIFLQKIAFSKTFNLSYTVLGISLKNYKNIQKRDFLFFKYHGKCYMFSFSSDICVAAVYTKL